MSAGEPKEYYSTIVDGWSTAGITQYNYAITTDTTTFPNWASWPQPLSIEDDCGQPCIVLRYDNRVIGRVYLGKGDKPPLEFFGNTSESTKIFMTALKKAADDYVYKAHKKMVDGLVDDLKIAEKTVRHFNSERVGAIDIILDTIKSHLGNLKVRTIHR